MRIPKMRGVIDRRILANYCIAPERLTQLLPAPFRPQLISGYGMAGICLIRLRHLRPQWMPGMLGFGSENAAHRIAVEWEADGQLRTGVYIPRRDTTSRLNILVGGRVFPGEHHLADFNVIESEDHYRVAMQSRDRSTQILFEGRPTDSLPADSIFSTVAEASDFFECGAVGCSPNRRNGTFDVLELDSLHWQVQPLDVECVESSFFDDLALFPQGSLAFDNALLMRNVDHRWQSHAPLQGDFAENYNPIPKK